MVKSRTTKIAFLLFFISIITLLGLPYTKWGFKTDDFGNIYHAAKLSSWSDVCRLFYEGNMEKFNHASEKNKLPTEQHSSFFCGLYRPLSFIYYWIQYQFFGTHPYGYFLIAIIFHALNSVILFNIFFRISASLLLAYFASALFAFHPSLWNWIGWVSAQTYFIELFVLLLLLLLLLQRYIHSRKISYYFFACFLFAANVFLKEATLFLPFWLIGACYFYFKRASSHFKQTSLQKLLKSIAISSGFWLVSIGYVFARLVSFPLSSNTTTLTFEPTLMGFITRMKSRGFDFVSYTSDFFTLSWMPQKHPFFKGTLILIISSFLIWLFIRNTKKSLLLFFVFSTIIFSWPALLMHYQPRYIYMAIPFFLFYVLVGLMYQKNAFYLHPQVNTNSICKYVATTVAIILFIFYVPFLTKKLRLREERLHQVTQSFVDLLKNNQIKSRPLFFLVLPKHWFSMGTAQAMWLLSNNDSYPVYQGGPSIELAEKYSYREIPAFEKNYLSIKTTTNGFIFESTNTDKLWFVGLEEKKESEFFYSFPKQKEKSLVFITWDYQKAKFKILKTLLG
jgi:hypothetical protein